MQEAVLRAVNTMWTRYREPLSLDAMADSAYLSKFYFSRLFKATTGTSPVQFLTAIRLYKAKRMLLESTLTVTDIAHAVGYNSAGTFIARFTHGVGVSPARFRDTALTGTEHSPVACRQGTGTIRGRIDVPATEHEVRVFVAAFDTPIAQGRPVAFDLLDGAGDFELREVPDRRLHVRAAAVMLRDKGPVAGFPLAVGASGTVRVRAGGTGTVNLALHPTGQLDLPVLIHLPQADAHHSSKAA